MSLFKCKSCGGDLEIVEGSSIAECEYCGLKQPVPKAVDENLQNLFNRANALRIKSEFDKAEKIYERIIQADSTQADAYWGLILCKYGIEYVDDPETYEKIPTCHRASYDSIIADDDYKAALANADMSQRILYEKQAHEIDRIQKEILALAQQEEAYDVFICYKETDPSGARTHDSVIANDIYYQLTEEGFKVFYAAITLEGKLGSAYEPIIFAALNSAKVMLAIGTKPEYFSAVWVKNEWSRYLKIVKQDHSKLLIPCYKDMDAYELPEEFAHLQAQDMSKIGFINDLIRGIKKVLQKDEPKVIETTVVSAGTATNSAPLLKRAFMFLEDGDWTSADEYCEKVLDVDPENAEAYLGKLMVELHVRKREYLKKLKEPFDGIISFNYQKIIRFGSAALVKEMEQYNADIRARNEEARKQTEENRKASIYREAEALAKQQTLEQQIAAAKKFEEIPGYRDADARAKACREKSILIRYEDALASLKKQTDITGYIVASQRFRDLEKEYPPAKEKAEECLAKAYEGVLEIAEKATTSKSCMLACQLFDRLVAEGYMPAKEKAKECKNKASQLDYEAALAVMEKATTYAQYIDAMQLFMNVTGAYAAEAEKKAKECTEKANELAEKKRKDEIYTAACGLIALGKKNEDISSIESAIEAFQDIMDWKDSSAQIDHCHAAIADIKDAQERRRIAHEQAVKKKKKKAAIVLSVIGVLAVFAVLLITVIIPTMKYNEAISMMEKGDYNSAKTVFSELDGFKTSNNKLAVISAIDTVKAGKFDDAIKQVLSASEPMTVKYDLGGGTSSKGNEFKYLTSADYSGLITAQKEGYRFYEWKLSGYSYTRENSLELVLEAVWSDGYFLTYELNGGTAENPYEYHKDGASVTLNNPVREGYTFIGWTGTDLDTPTVNLTIPAGSWGDRNYVANWKANEYTFTLNANGGIVSNSSISANYDASYTLPTPTRDYYTFAGWYDGTKKYENGTWNKASNVTLTAKWTPVSYTITYNLSGGTNSSQNVKNFTVESQKILLEDPTKTGYKFLGWYSDSSYSNQITEIAAGSHGNISLYAKWEIINYTITYDLNGGSVSETLKTTFTVNDLPLALPTPTKSGLSFLNWSKGSFDGEAISKITEVGNITVVASYMDPNLKLQLSSDTSYYIVTDYASSGSATVLDIPAYYNGKPIKEIGGSAFSGCSSLVTIQIPSTVNKIGYSAFSDCSNLKNVNIPDGITSIDSSTFSECRALVSITLPNSITSIGEDAFDWCISLTTINLPSGLKSIGDSAFSFCRSLKSISIPSGVTELGFGVFYDCSSLTSVTLPNTMKKIDGYAFNGCSSLTKIIIPASVTSMGTAFPGCSKLTIYCRATVIPDGWSSGWNNSRPVVWGYTGN